MFVTDGTIVNVALPVIQRQLGFSTPGLTWVVTAYALAYGGFMLLSGRLAGRLGPRRALIIGVAAFVIASVAGAFAMTPEWLIAARVGQGLSAALAAPSGFMLVMTNTSAGTQRTRALSLLVVASALGGALGLLTGALLTTAFGWRSVMLVNAPLGVLVLIGAWLSIREGGRRRDRLDIWGAALSTATMCLFVFALTAAQTGQWLDPVVLGALGGAAVSTIVLILVERRHAAPILPMGIFSTRVIAGPLLASFFTSAGLSAYLFFMALYTQQVLGLGPMGTGLTLLPFVLAQIVSSQLGQILVRLVGERVTGTAGLGILAAGQMWLSFLDGGLSFGLSVIAPTIIMGIGVGLGFPQMLSVVLNNAPPTDVGTTSSLMNVIQQLGAAVGMASLTGLSVSAGESFGQARGIGVGILTSAFFIAAAVGVFAVSARRISPELEK